MSSMFNIHPHMKVELGDSGTPTRTVFEGYGGGLDLSELPSQQEAGGEGYIVYPFSLNDAGIQPTTPAWQVNGEWFASSVMFVPGLPGNVSPIMARPVHDTRMESIGDPEEGGEIVWSQEVDESYWNLHGTGSWYDSDNWEYSGRVFPPRMRYRGENMGSYDDWTYIQSKFELPDQPLFSVYIKSTLGLAKEYWGASTTDPYYAYVKFGITSQEYYLLKIPFEGPVSMYWKHNIKTDGEFLELPSTKDFSFNIAGEELSPDQTAADYDYIWVLSTGRGILVGNKGMAASTFFRSPEMSITPSQPHHIKTPVQSGPIEIGYNGGKWECAYVPIWMPPSGYYQTPVMNMSYPWDSSSKPTNIRIYQAYVLDEGEWAETEPDSGVPAIAFGTPIMGYTLDEEGWDSRVSDGEKKHEYGVEIRTSKTVDAETDLICYRSPLVYSMHFHRLGVVESLTPISYTNIEADTLSASFAQDIRSPDGGIVVDNQDGGWGPTLDDWTPRRIRVFANWAQKTESEESS